MFFIQQAGNVKARRRAAGFANVPRTYALELISSAVE